MTMPTREEWEAGLADLRRIRGELNALVKRYAPAEQDTSVPVPANADQAVLMISLAAHYLHTHAPDRLRPELRPLAGEIAKAFS